jgi:hypothetical protein
MIKDTSGWHTSATSSKVSNPIMTLLFPPASESGLVSILDLHDEDNELDDNTLYEPIFLYPKALRLLSYPR